MWIGYMGFSCNVVLLFQSSMGEAVVCHSEECEDNGNADMC